MPIHKQGSGWQWGNHGKVYPTREDAEKQAAAAHAHGYTGDSMASRAAISKKIAEEIEKGHDPKQAVAIAYSELGEDMSPEDWAGLTDGLMKFFAEEQEESAHATDGGPGSGIKGHTTAEGNSSSSVKASRIADKLTKGATSPQQHSSAAEAHKQAGLLATAAGENKAASRHSEMAKFHHSQATGKPWGADSADSENLFADILSTLVGKLNEEDFAQFAVALKNYFSIATDGGPGSK